jgi:secreted PhoX family phosphatase
MHHVLSRVSAQKAIVAGSIVGMTILAQSVGAFAQYATPEEASGAAGATTTALTPGSMTTVRSFLVPEAANVTITPLLTSGEMVGDYQFAGTPDGMGAYKDGNDVVLFVNHEWTPMEPGSDEGNISGGRVSRIVLDGTTGAPLSGTYVVDGTEGWWDLCSASFASVANGYSTPFFLSGEETTDGPMGGESFAVDAETGEVTPLPWLGHFNHEQELPVPGFGDKKVIFLTDDDASGSEIYMYVADSEDDLLSGEGQLYVFKANDATGTADIAKGTTLSGEFVAIDQKDNADAETLQKAVDAAGAFKFVRAEDVSYDPASPNILYFADTGDNADPNLDASGTPLTANGRIYKITLDPSDPTKVTALDVVLDGDKGDDIRNPDNVAVSAGGKTLLIEEDLNGYNRQENSDATGRVLSLDLESGTLTTIAKLDQSDSDKFVNDGDVAGSWEASGIIDVSDLFGPGTWLTGVQAHTRTTPQLGGEDEGGQILLIKTS